MLSLLQHFNYQPPALKAESFGQIEIREQSPGYFYMYVNGDQWMAYNTNSHLEAYELYSHYTLAKGHVIVTGMGFGVRENWILTKSEVTKLTIIERSQQLIDYHRQRGSAFLNDPRVEVICMDATDLTGSCDVLLLDHYELSDFEPMLANAKQIHDQVDCKDMWLWPFERIVMHSRRWHTFNDPPYRLLTKCEAAELLKKNWGLHKLHTFSEQEMNLMCMMYHSKMFSQSENILEGRFNDRQQNFEIYRCI